jgi:putative transposase
MKNVSQLSLATFTERQRERALERFALIRPHLEEGVPLTTLACTSQKSASTLQRWARNYREEGLGGLAPQRRSDGGKSRGLPKDEVLLIEGLALQTPRRPLTSIQSIVNEVAKEQSWPTVSYAQVYRIVQRLPEDVKTLAQKGGTAYQEQFDVLYRRQASVANGIWQADHCRLRIFVVKEDGTGDLPWLTTIEDDYSRAVPGYHLGWSAPSALRTGQALRQAIGKKEDQRWPMHGVPSSFYTDHGSDFTSRHMEAVASDLKMVLVFSQKRKPRGRGKKERFYRTVQEDFLSKLPGYAPKVKEGEDLQEQRRMNENARKEACLTLSQLDELFQTWLLETYHQHVHSVTHMTPHERWVDSGIIPVLPRSAEQLDLLLLQPRRRHKVHQEGIRLLGSWYMHALLGDYVGDSVLIRYDPTNLATIRVYVVDSLEEERFLCQAESVERGGQGVTLREVVDARRSHRKQVGEKVRERKQTVTRYASPKALARRALSRLGSLEKPSQDVSAISETAAPELFPETSGASASKMRWYDADEGEIALSVAAIPNADASSASISSLLSEPSGSFPSNVRWYDDE